MAPLDSADLFYVLYYKYTRLLLITTLQPDNSLHWDYWYGVVYASVYCQTFVGAHCT